MRILTCAAAAALVCSIAAGAALAGTDTVIPTAGIWDFVQPYVLALFSVAVTAVVGWLAAYLKAKWGLEIDAAHSRAIQDAALNAAGLVLRKAQGALPVSVDLKNPLLALAVDYVGAAVPAAVAHFGLTPEKIAEKVLAKLPQLAARAMPDA